MVAEKMLEMEKPITKEDIFLYINSCDVMHSSINKQTKSIYFKDNDNNLTVFIFSFLHNHSTVLATINGEKVNMPIDNEEFLKIFNKYKIFTSGR